MSKVKLFTHGADLDGIGCAILAYLAFGRENVDVEYCNYDDVDDKVEYFFEQEELYRSYDFVYITDISVSDDVAKLIGLLSAEKHNLNLFDHHATALRLNKYPLWARVRVTDLDTGLRTSGTEMFYEHLECRCYFEKFNKVIREAIKRFVEIVRDYDTWRWKELGDEGAVCKQVNDLFHIYGRKKFIKWAIKRIKIMYTISPLLNTFPSFGEHERALLEQKQKDIDRYVEKKDKQLAVITDKFGYLCGVVFAEQYFSELGNRLCKMHPELHYVAMIDISYGKIEYRSIRDDIDLGGEIAHSFGGGGHNKAAGSQFDSETLKMLVTGYLFNQQSLFGDLECMEG